MTVARIAALMQMLAPESAELRLGLVKYLAAVPHVEATQGAGAAGDLLRRGRGPRRGIDALKVRREKDYTDILVEGLRYPWPAVASGRRGHRQARPHRPVPELVAVLDEADPRLPAMKDVEGKKVAVVRELVRINHHRNCLMCHAPGNTGTSAAGAITAEVPIPGQPLPSPSRATGSSSPDLMVRIDVTYLRQDFSAMLPVGTRTRGRRCSGSTSSSASAADHEEADEYRNQLTPKEPGVLSPYHRAALRRCAN